MKRATLTGREARAVEEDACSVDDPGLAAGKLPFGDMIRTLVLDPAADAPVLLVLPLACLQLPDRLTDPLLILGIGEMCPQSAAAVMRPVGVNALAAVAIDAGPSRSEPGEIAAENLAVVSWISELHEGPGEADQHFRHARQCMPDAPGHERGNRAPPC